MTLAKIPTKYIDYTNIFSLEQAMKLLRNADINKYIIKHKKKSSYYIVLFMFLV